MTLPSGFGVGIPHQRAENDPGWYAHVLGKLEPEWWYDWKSGQTHYENYLPMLWRCSQHNVSQIASVAAMLNRPLWLLGNEPDLMTQSNTQPIEFAHAVQRWKDNSGGAFAVPGVLACGFGYGYDWMDEYLHHDGPIPDVWHFHIYAHGYDDWMEAFEEARIYFGRIADRPMIISECAAWMAQDNLSVMDAVWEVCAKGWVQAAAWFSAYYHRWVAPSLMTVDGKLTVLGEKYISNRQVTYLPHVVAAEGS